MEFVAFERQKEEEARELEFMTSAQKEEELKRLEIENEHRKQLHIAEEARQKERREMFAQFEAAKLAEASPLPSEDTTPPVIKMNLVIIFTHLLVLEEWQAY